jgi:hypothetical protein
VPHDFQVDKVAEGCNMVVVVLSSNVPRWLNVIVDLNGILCSCVQKSSGSRKGYQQKRFFPKGFVHSASVPMCIGPKAVYIRP